MDWDITLILILSVTACMVLCSDGDNACDEVSQCIAAGECQFYQDHLLKVKNSNNSYEVVSFLPIT